MHWTDIIHKKILNGNQLRTIFMVQVTVSASKVIKRKDLFDKNHLRTLVIWTFTSVSQCKTIAEDVSNASAFPSLSIINVIFVCLSIIHQSLDKLTISFIALTGPFLNFIPWMPIVADRFTQQTIIYSSTGGKHYS